MFWQVMDHPGVEGNYLETSGTALFAYAVLKGVRLGYLPKRMAAWAEKAFYGTCDRYLSRTRTAACSWMASAWWQVWAARITATAPWPTTSVSLWSATMPRA